MCFLLPPGNFSTAQVTKEKKAKIMRNNRFDDCRTWVSKIILFGKLYIILRWLHNTDNFKEELFCSWDLGIV